MKRIVTSMITVLLAMAMLFSLAGCGKTETQESDVQQTETSDAQNSEKDSTAEGETNNSETSGEAETGSETTEESIFEGLTDLRDGDRFEKTIMIEGTEVTVQVEHAINRAVGFELDYEYEDLQRRVEGNLETFLSVYDDPEHPWNFLDIVFFEGDVAETTEQVVAELEGDYESVETEDGELENAGACTLVHASGDKTSDPIPGALVTVYIIPRGNGCIVASAHCTYESAGGFGKSFDAMMNSLMVIEF